MADPGCETVTRSARLIRAVRALPFLASWVLATPTASAQAPWWMDSLGYSPSDLFPVRVGDDGFPYVRVRIDGTELWLLFDTGNMSGLTVASRHYDALELERTGVTRRRDSSGEVIGESRVGRARRVEALGHTASDVRVLEFGNPRLPGLFGPGSLPGSRFTLDYRRQVIAVTTTSLEASAQSDALLLVPSRQHPRLILVEGAFRGTPVLIELDTGKSRTVVDPAWATRVGLAVGTTDTVVVGTVRVGRALFDVRDAKPVGLGGIDPELPRPLVLSLGSDTLSRFVLTVDYGGGVVLLWER